MDRSDLANRMKEYERVSNTYLIKRTPVILRLDGKAFHSFTKGLKRPFDEVLIKTMQDTMKYLCANIQGCVLGYHQSDEITLVLVDYKRLNTSPWFENKVSKMCSIAASMATLEFNKKFKLNCHDIPDRTDKTYLNKLLIISDRRAMFDCRAFNLPKEEVCNNLIWRQQDATRNSIQMVGQAYFSYSELQGKNRNEIQTMLMEQKGIDWNDYPTYQKRGSCCVKQPCKLENGIIRNKWMIDKEIPIFTEDRAYIEDLVDHSSS